MAEKCNHKHISFGSGGYYLICLECFATWARVGGQPEYGFDKNGNPVGSNPSLVDKIDVGVFDLRAALKGGE
jgi:hypothetical protein